MSTTRRFSTTFLLRRSLSAPGQNFRAYSMDGNSSIPSSSGSLIPTESDNAVRIETDAYCHAAGASSSSDKRSRDEGSTLPAAGPVLKSRKTTAVSSQKAGKDAHSHSRLMQHNSPSSPYSAVHPMFLPRNQSAPAKIDSDAFRWLAMLGGSCHHGVHLNPKSSPKVAAFDLDGTLIKPNSGAAFAKDATDWKWWGEASVVTKKLKELHDDGQVFSFAVFQQAGWLTAGGLDTQ